MEYLVDTCAYVSKSYLQAEVNNKKAFSQNLFGSLNDKIYLFYSIELSCPAHIF